MGAHAAPRQLAAILPSQSLAVTSADRSAPSASAAPDVRIDGSGAHRRTLLRRRTWGTQPNRERHIPVRYQYAGVRPRKPARVSLGRRVSQTVRTTPSVRSATGVRTKG